MSQKMPGHRLGYYCFSLVIVLQYSFVFSVEIPPVAVEYLNDRFCLLCDDGIAGLTQPEKLIDDGQTTCLQKALTMAANIEVGQPLCEEESAAWKNDCCAVVENGNEQEEEEEELVGSYSPCGICTDDTLPGNPDAVLNMMYFGVGSCSEYDDWGKNGLVQDDMCHSLKFFSGGACACGISQNQVPSENESGSGSDLGERKKGDDSHHHWWCMGPLGIIAQIPIIC